MKAKGEQCKSPLDRECFRFFQPFSIQFEREFFFWTRWWILKRNYSEKSFSAMNDYKFVKVKHFSSSVIPSEPLGSIFVASICGKVWLILEKRKEETKKLFLVLCLSAAGDPKVATSYGSLRLPSRSSSDFIAFDQLWMFSFFVAL